MAAALFDPSTYPALTADQAATVSKVSDFAQQVFRNPKFDASHDFNHVIRVVSNALRIMELEQKAEGPDAMSRFNAFTVILGALLHDVDDRKYVNEEHGGLATSKQELLRLGMSEIEAHRIQVLIDGVSYSSEIKNPERVEALIRDIPELAIVQDADRLDAIGAIGIARCFTFGGAKQARKLELSVQHFLDKLVKLKDMMKTDTGKALAEERTSRLREYLQWWDDETSLYQNH